MRLFVALFVGLPFFFTGFTARAAEGVAEKADEMPFHIPAVETHLISSEIVDQTFEIHVWQPISKTDGSEKFPVLYMTDVNGSFDFGSAMHLMNIGQDAPRVIMVGIGYPGDHVFNGFAARNRDLTPVPSTESDQFPLLPVKGISTVLSGKTTGGGPEFLAFIRNELIPFIDANYKTVKDDRAFAGQSLGGLFGLYTLFHEPETFNRYIIGSPSIWYGKEISLDYARDFMASDKQLNANVFLTVGQLEEDSESRMVSNVYRLHGILKSRKMPAMKLGMNVVPNETHTSVLLINLVRGVQEIYGKPKCHFLDSTCSE